MHQLLGLPLGLEAPVMTPNGVNFLFLCTNRLSILCFPTAAAHVGRSFTGLAKQLSCQVVLGCASRRNINSILTVVESITLSG